MNKCYATSDLHGVYNLWEQIKNYCDDTDTIYFLGDAADRGPDGLRIMRELFQDKRVRYIKGNHEDIMEKVAPNLMEGRSFDSALWTQNGGTPTIKSFMALSEASQFWFLRKISALPNYIAYINSKNQEIILSHAGTNPDDVVPNKPLNHYGESPWQWDRTHFYSKWNPDEKYRNTYIIHGHTPVPYIRKYLNEVDDWSGHSLRYPNEWDGDILVYADGHKVDIDLFSAYSGRACLFDLDELKVEKYFELEGVK